MLTVILNKIKNLFKIHKVIVKYKLRTPKGKLPIKATTYSAGYDLYACETTSINPNKITRVFTDILIEIPKGYFGLVTIRNSLALDNNLQLANGAGVIDADYRGELVLPVINNSNKMYFIKKGEHFAQLMLLPSYNIKFKKVKKLSKTERNDYGFDSLT